MPDMDLSGVTRPVVVPVRVDPTGKVGPSRRVAGGPRWRSTSHGYYVPATVDSAAVDQRVVEAAVCLPDAWGAVTGWAALAWMGARWFEGSPWGGGPPLPVTLAIGGNRAIRPQAGIDTSEERLLPTEFISVDGVRLTTAVRSTGFEMRYARSMRQAVVALDMACFSDVVSTDEMAGYAATLNGWTGVPQLREAIPLADENAWSPREVSMRLNWTLDAGLPRPRCNQPVFDRDGRFLGTPDLLDVASGVVGEYDGALHLAGTRRSKDLVREDRFRRHGLEYVTMVAADQPDPSAFLVRLRSAYDRAADIPESRKLWTVEPPEWWHDTTTVAARRALDGPLRERLLAHRAA